MNAVVIDHVSKRFGSHQAVNDLSLTVPSGCIYGFIGPNGSGKTTTLRMILRILHPDSGSIEVLGAHTFTAANDRIGYLPEERGLYKQMRVGQALAFHASLKGMSDSREAIRAWLERMGLSAWRRERIVALSKGMAQKVQFIATVISKPELVVLDEPFSGLDPVNMEVLRDAILELKKEGTTVLFSTHDMGVAEQMCDYLCMIYRGNKVLDGTLEGIKETYGRDTVRVRVEEVQGRLNELPGVKQVLDLGQLQELRLEPGADTQRLLRALLERGEVSHFEQAHPTLHDIFVRIAGTSEKE